MVQGAESNQVALSILISCGSVVPAGVWWQHMRNAVPAVRCARALNSGSTLIRYVHIQFTRGLSASVLIRLLRSLWCAPSPACFSLRGRTFWND